MQDLSQDESLPIEARVEIWRREALAGTLTKEQLAAAVRAMRAGRVSASTADNAKKAAKAPVDTTALLNKLKALGAKNAGGTGV